MPGPSLPEGCVLRDDDRVEKADRYLRALCAVRPNRRTGSAGNAAATALVADALRPFVSEIEAAPFACLDYRRSAHSLACGPESFAAFVSPYSRGCDVRARLVAASTRHELEQAACQGEVLLLSGELCSEQLMPKNFVFYNPEHHRALIALLERQRPAAIVASTGTNPEQVGALDPYPLFVDGDFDIPSLYCRLPVGEALARRRGEIVHLAIDAERIPSTAANVVARIHPGAARKIVVTAHMDAYEDTPGALDNASGTVVLMLLGEMLASYPGEHGVEIVALNGEDHYSAAGQMDYLQRFRGGFGRISLAINVDDVGYRRGRTAYSFYECAPELQQRVEAVLCGADELIPGDPWYNGDHMLFVQNGVPCVALTAEQGAELMRTVTHTERDTPDLVDGRKLAAVAWALNELVRAL